MSTARQGNRRAGSKPRSTHSAQDRKRTTSFFVLEEIVPSVLEQMPVGFGTSPLNASPLTHIRPGIEHLATSTMVARSAGSAVETPTASGGGAWRSSSDAMSGHRETAPTTSPAAALAEYDAVTSAARVVYAAAALRRRKQEAQKRAEAASIKAAVPLSHTVTQRLRDHHVPSSIGARAVLYDRLGITVPAPSPSLLTSANEMASFSSAAATPEPTASGSRRRPRDVLSRPIVARVVQHQRDKWGFHRDEGLFFRPSHRAPTPNMGDANGIPPPAAARRAEEEHQQFLAKPLLFPIKTTIFGRPRSAASLRGLDVPTLLQSQVSARQAQFGVHGRVELADALHEAHLLALNAEQLLAASTMKERDAL